jgi:hypothetical protein
MLPKGATHMKRASFILSALVALFLSANAVAAVTTNAIVPIDQNVFIPCANGGSGEDVPLRGPLHILSRTTITGKTAHVDIQANPQDVTGVGSVTGAVYKATGITRQAIQVNGPGFPANETFVNNFRIIGRDAAPSFLLHETFHVTIDANGTLTAAIDNFSVSCR